MTDDSRSEREKAAYGPRSLKAPGSPEWCWQTLDMLVADFKRIDERFEEVGGALLQLEGVKAWEVIPTDEPYGSLERMLAMEVGIDGKTIRREIKQARKRRKLAQQGGERGTARGEGGRFVKSDKPQGDNVTLRGERGNSRAYILDRLDRDGMTELAADVRCGLISAKAASIKAGWGKKPTITCPHCGKPFTP